MDINALTIIYLNKISGFGPKTIEKLISNLKNLKNIWQFSDQNLKKVGLKNSQIKEFNKMRNQFKPEKLRADLKRKNINYLTLYDHKYPQKLRDIYDPPPVIFYKGALNFQLPAVAVIGSRNSTVYGRKIASQTAVELAKMGVNIVSGLANGIDATAHKGALSVEAGITTAVLGNGFDYLYPSQNNILSQKIADKGLMVTEFNPEIPPRAQNFPRRNRIISALSDLILVVEAGAKSGTLITVDYALEHSKDIMAVPANIDRPNSVGCNSLIKKGAAIFTKVSDVTDYLNQYLQQEEGRSDFLENGQLINKIYPDLNYDELKVLKLFQHEIEIYYNDLIKLSNLTTEKIDRILVKLELMNIIIRLKGKKYQFKGLQNLLKPI